MSVYENPVLRVVSEDTGIQLTRVFRLFNGSEMKLSEYLVFKEKINKKVEIRSLEDLGEKCDLQLGKESRQEISLFLGKKLKMQRLKLISSDLKLVA